MGHPQSLETRKKISRTLRGDHRGRPTIDTPLTRQKIEEAASLDASVEEIAFYAGISRETYYQIIKKDKAFSDRILALRQRPVLKARQTVVQSLSDPQNAFRYLEKKRKVEFGNTVDVTSNGESVAPRILQIIVNRPNERKETGNKSNGETILSLGSPTEPTNS
jgi:hypothetical protein